MLGHNPGSSTGRVLAGLWDYVFFFGWIKVMKDTEWDDTLVSNLPFVCFIEIEIWTAAFSSFRGGF